MVVSRSESVLIVGAGCFGISTAYHLLQRGFTDVTVLDQSEELPAPDAASTDINKSKGNPCFLARSRDT
jgi:sarcosine oxidase/L-pipecolate oxidase